MSEGVALAKKSDRMAFSQVPAQHATLQPQESRLVVGDVEVAGGTAKPISLKTVYMSRSAECRLEAQDFCDRKMTMTCYEPKGLGSVMSMDIATGKVENMSKVPGPGTYNEVEGIFPDGQYTLVEADRQCEKLGGTRGSGNIDIRRLDGTGRDFVRLTHFNDFEAGKSSNPVVSTDGRLMSFQSARTTD